MALEAGPRKQWADLGLKLDLAIDLIRLHCQRRNVQQETAHSQPKLENQAARRVLVKKAFHELSLSLPTLDPVINLTDSIPGLKHAAGSRLQAR
ncbi:hypothetical protein OAL71_01010 [Phycisphaerales bacterium]|nr:hypothetical protein [Phycisphaerales bacterium]